MGDTPVIGIPVKPFGVAKQRLHPRVGQAERSTLGKAIAAHTLQAAAETGCRVLVITGDGGVRRWAHQLGFTTLTEGPPGSGLNGAAAALRDHAATTEASWLLLHADLPALTTADVAAVTAILERAPVISPSYDGGTNALGATGHVDFSYGPGSFHRHLRRLPSANVVVRPGLAFDLDTTSDLDAALKVSPWIGAALDSPP